MSGEHLDTGADQAVADLINRYGDGEHPEATPDNNNLRHFTREYLDEILRRAAADRKGDT